MGNERPIEPATQHLEFRERLWFVEHTAAERRCCRCHSVRFIPSASSHTPTSAHSVSRDSCSEIQTRKMMTPSNRRPAVRSLTSMASETDRRTHPHSRSSADPYPAANCRALDSDWSVSVHSLRLEIGQLKRRSISASTYLGYFSSVIFRSQIPSAQLACANSTIARDA